ncbi:hypothetical protein DL96DRAFT_1551377 [Flagelloscypha sp. PMI_526]|nr:hypothetical protein DL96DRAFT_1551377 [Flagelloscypha sp. PMI_526]
MFVSGKKPNTNEDTKKTHKTDHNEDNKRRDRKPPDISVDGLDMFLKNITDIHALWTAADTVEECERNLKDSCQQLNTLLYRKERPKNNQGRWNVLISRAAALAAKIENILPKVDIVVKMSEAVKGDVDCYVAFLKGITNDDEAERNRAQTELA